MRDELSFEAVGRPLVDASESRLRLQTIVRLRWFAIAGQLAAVAVVAMWLRYPLPVGYCLLLITLSAWLNVYLRVSYPSRHRLSPALATALLAYDVLQLAALLYLTGGIDNPFTVLIVAPVTVSAATLPPRNTILLGALALSAAALLVPFHLPLPWAENQVFEMPVLYRIGMYCAVACCLIFLALYAGRLSREGRQMSAALAATELVLAREQKLHALDGLAAAAAHELGTPLATIVVVTKELERELPEGSPFTEDIALLRSQAQRCREILQKLTQRPSEQDPLHSSISMSQLLEEAASPYRSEPIDIAIDAGPSAAAETPGADEPVGERRPGVIYGLGNIVENAVDFAASKVEIVSRWNEREVTIVVSDDGPGFSPEILDSIGDPYVTTRPAGTHGGGDGGRQGGLGLGFFIAKTLLERSGAALALGNRTPEGGGAVVRISWPRAAFEASAAAAAAAAQGQGSGLVRWGTAKRPART